MYIIYIIYFIRATEKWVKLTEGQWKLIIKYQGNSKSSNQMVFIKQHNKLIQNNILQEVNIN